MKLFILIMITSLCQLVYAEEPFDFKIYTPSVVVDSFNQGPKGAVQLLWQKNPETTRFEIEVSNGNGVYSQVGEKHFHHLMIYFGKDYQWRVREVSARRTTDFSPWMPLRVEKGNNLARMEHQREPVSVESPRDVEEYMLDTGGQ